MDREPIPTFQNKWDRLTYLLSEFSTWIGIGAVVGIGLLLWFRPTVDVDPWMTAAFGGFVLVALAAAPVGLKFATMLRNYRYVEVHHINAVDEVVEKYMVPPAVWDEKTVDGAKPWPVNDGDAWGVREFQYHESTDTLVVSGTWMRDAADDALATDRAHMEEMHDFLLESYQVVCQLRGRFSRMAMDIERQTINSVHEAQERGTMMDRTAAKEVWEDAAQELEDVIPDDHPEIEDADELADRRDPMDNEDRAVPRDQMTPKTNGHHE